MYGYHNNIIVTIPNFIPSGIIVKSNILQSRGDNLHFSSAIYREFGKRYTQVMIGLLK